MTHDFAADLAAVASIGAVPTILEVVCRSTGLGFAAVARVTDERWIACAVRDEIAFGLAPGGELPIATTFCDRIRASGELVAIDDAETDGAYRDHPSPRMYGFRSYVSVPVRRPDGRFFGTLCAIDARPARVSDPATLGMFRLFADLIGFHLDARDRLAASKAALAEARDGAARRERFIAALGHDLRNRLASIDAGARLLGRMPLGDRALHVAALIHDGAARMARLVDDALDLAHDRLGGGLRLRRTDGAGLAAALDRAIGELREAWPDRAVLAEVALARPVPCDPARVAQFLSNLLTHALADGDPAGPVRVEARGSADGLSISVSGAGPTIPPDVLGTLFEPFAPAAREGADGEGSGRRCPGLGLCIAAAIARAHGGTIEAASAAGETRLTFRMPPAAG